MVRPRGADANHTKQRILESALSLFGERGVDGASIRDIGAFAGVTLATVHHYFGTKEELYAAVIDVLHTQLQALAFEVMISLSIEKTPESQIEDIIRRCFRFAQHNRSSIQVLLRTVIERGDVGERRLVEFQAPLLKRVTTALSMVSGRTPRELRVHTQNLMFLITRHAISSPAERTLMTQHTQQDKAAQAIEDSLVDTALALLLTPKEPAKPKKTRKS
jgi:AcrR family transcriptional regulator